MKVNIVLLVGAVVIFLNPSSGDELGSNCMETAFCCLIKGDIARESEKYGKDPAKYYKESEDYLAKAAEFNKSKTESIQKGCEASYKICSDEVVTMAIESLNFPISHRSTCSFAAYSRNIFGCKNIKKWPMPVMKYLPDEHIACRIECIIDDANKYVLSNGKQLEKIPRREEDMSKLPEGLEPRFYVQNGSVNMPNDRPVAKWFSGFKDTGSAGWGRVDTCPEGSWVYRVDNFDVTSEDIDQRVSPLYHVDMVCRDPSKNTRKDDNVGHIISEPARPIKIFNSSVNDTSDPRKEGQYDFLKIYDDCGIVNGVGTLLIGISLSRRTHDQGTKGIGFVNTLCGDSKEWNLHNSTVDSDLMVCDPGTAVCSVQTKNGNIQAHFGPTSTTVDLRIGCCTVPNTYDNKVTNLAQTNTTTTTPAPVTQPQPVVIPVPPTAPSDGGDEGIFKLQRLFLLIWGQVLNQRITRYNYYYTPENVDKEREWETIKCADGTFVNGFEVATPVSNYYWTRRIMQLKFLCGAVDGSKANELDLYKRLTQGKFTLREPEPGNGGKNECKGGHYTSMQIDYYMDKERTKAALVNAWALTMKCTKGGNSDPHKHLINSTPRNSVTENLVQSGVVDCGTGKAICGFINKITENRKGAFEGLYYKIVCCSV